MTRYIGQNPNSSIYDANGVWSLNNVSAATEAKNWPNPKYSGTNTFKDGIFKGEPYITIYNNTNILESVNPIIPYSPIDTNPDPHWNNVSLLIRGTGVDGSTTITDSSSFNHSITLPTAGGTNNASISSGVYIFDNGSIIFDGSFDLFQLPTSSSLDFGTENFTIECWMRTNGTQNTFSTIFSRYISSTNLTAFFNNHSTALGFVNASNNTEKQTLIGSYAASLLNNNSWHHLAITRNSNFIFIFIDGILCACSSNTDTNDVFSLSNARVGKYQGDNLANKDYNGYLSEIRFTKGINRYPIVKDFSPPTTTYPTGVNDPFWNNVSLLLNFDGSNGSTTFTDISPNPKIFTVNGNASISTVQSKFGGSSFYFDGTGDYITTPANTDFTFGTSNFTVEGWIYITSFNSQYVNIFTTSGGLSNFNFSVRSDARLEYWNGSSAIQLGKIQDVPTNQWVHIAFVRSNFVIFGYVNGILVGCTSDNTNLSNNAIVSIAATATYTNSAIGYLDDLRITKGIARYTTTSFSPPRLRFPGA